ASVALETMVAALGALVVLAFVFASFMAFVPLLMALVAIPTTFLLVWPLASVTDVSVIVQFLVALIGLGIAIDYALLVVVRWREERQRPAVSNEAAVRHAMQHAGSAVVFSGTTVAISLLALFAVPVRSGDPAAVAQAAARVDGVQSAAAPADWHRDGTSLVTIIPTQDGNSPAGRATLARLRDAGLPGDVTIGGEAAQSA